MEALFLLCSFSDGGRPSSASIFVGGFVLGGLVVGALGCVFAPQVILALQMDAKLYQISPCFSIIYICYFDQIKCPHIFINELHSTSIVPFLSNYIIPDFSLLKLTVQNCGNYYLYGYLYFFTIHLHNLYDDQFGLLKFFSCLPSIDQQGTGWS